jgi:hypothetical protein
MKFIEPPTVGVRGPARSGDEMDRLLYAYFQAEMPHPWPELDPPAYLSVPSTRLAFWRRIKRSHLALAASVALLIGGSLGFGDQLPSVGRIFKGETIASTPIEDRELHAPKEKEPTIGIEVGPEGAALRLDMPDRY